jgi:hypothetical protein
LPDGQYRRLTALRPPERCDARMGAIAVAGVSGLAKR